MSERLRTLWLCLRETNTGQRFLINTEHIQAEMIWYIADQQKHPPNTTHLTKQTRFKPCMGRQTHHFGQKAAAAIEALARLIEAQQVVADWQRVLNYRCSACACICCSTAARFLNSSKLSPKTQFTQSKMQKSARISTYAHQSVSTGN